MLWYIVVMNLFRYSSVTYVWWKRILAFIADGKLKILILEMISFFEFGRLVGLNIHLTLLRKIVGISIMLCNRFAAEWAWYCNNSISRYTTETATGLTNVAMMYTNIRTLYGQKRAQPYCPVFVPCGSMCMLCIDTDFHSNRLVLIRPTKQLMQDAWTRRTRETLIVKQYEQIATSSSFRINQAEKIKRFTG